jgi:PAS domain S-box-containing protein
LALDDSTWKRYAVAALAPLAALVAHAGVEWALGIDIQPLLILAVGFIIPAQLTGLGPGLFATAMLALMAAFFLLAPPYSLSVAAQHDQVRLAIFCAVGAVVSLLGGSLRRWRHQSRNERRARRAAERAQLEAQNLAAARLRMIVDTAYDAFVAFDPPGRITDWNPQAQQTFGWTRDEALGKPLLELIIPPQHRQTLAADIAQYLSDGQWALRRRFELTALHRDGREFPVEMTMSPVGSGDKLFFAAFIHDITERRAVEAALADQRKELERSNEELQQFAYVASHDLQEPLRMVASYTQLLSRRYKDKLGPDADEFIHYAVDGAQRMQTLINDLLAYSRVGTRGKPFEPVDLNQVVEIVKANLKVAIEESGAQLVVPASLPMVSGDRSQLVQLFQNLIGNAIKFHGEAAPRVEISAERDEPAGMWRFAVRDNGIGIDPEHHDRIFVIFQRLHTREHYQGTGIGLAVCRKIVERHGGKIGVESADGKGSIFHFTIADTEQT